MPDKPNKFLVFDVESVGLHGEGFAVGWVCIENGVVIDEARACCPIHSALGDDEGRAWVIANVPPMVAGFESPITLRDEFWSTWLGYKEWGAVLVADCAWPVEARFLAACVNDNLAEREWQGPYPLHDLASIILAKGGDPLATRERLPDELPAHDPLCDARQSARLLIEAMKDV
jgi:hypothetical protein